MSSPRLAALSILGLTTITAAGFAYFQYQRAEELAHLLAMAQETPAPPAARERPVPVAPVERPPQSVARAEPPVATEEVAAERERPERRPGDRGDMTARFEQLMADPEFAAAFKAQQRARLDGRYAELFAKLNLPPATLTRLQDLMSEKQNAARDVFSAARAEGLGRENREELRELMQMTQNEINREIEGLIGEAGVATLREYERTTVQRNMVEQLETRLSYAATPLNRAQAEAMVTIFTQTASSGGGPGGQDGRGGSPFDGGGDRPGLITADTLARAQAVLSPDQLKALSDLQAEQAAAQTINAAMRQSMQGSDGGGRRGPGG